MYSRVRDTMKLIHESLSGATNEFILRFYGEEPLLQRKGSCVVRALGVSFLDTFVSLFLGY